MPLSQPCRARRTRALCSQAAPLLAICALVTTGACSATGEPGVASDDAQYELVSIAGQPLPAPIVITRVNDGTTHYMVAVTGRLTLRRNGQADRVTNVRRLIDTLVVKTEQGGYTGTFERRDSTIVVRFRPGNAYDDYVEYNVREGGKKLVGLEDFGRVYVWSRIDNS